MDRPNEIVKSSWMSTLASTAVVIAALYMAKSLLVPLTLAVLLSKRRFANLKRTCGGRER